MWYVFNKEDSWECGWSVDSEKDAIKQCDADTSLNYCYVSNDSFPQW